MAGSSTASTSRTRRSISRSPTGSSSARSRSSTRRTSASRRLRSCSYPFVALWHWLVGLEGIVLYARHLHFLFTAGVAAAVFVSLRRLLDDSFSSAVYATAAIAFVPFGIHALSYNTFASGFFTAGCFLGAAWAIRGGRGFLVGAGCAHGLAIFTYPPFVLPVACCFAALYAASRPRSVRALMPGLVPAAAVTLLTVAFFAHRGIGTIDDLVTQTADFGDQGGGLGELADIASFLWTSFAHKYVAAALLVAAAAARLWRPGAALLPLLLLPLAALPADLRTSASANIYVTCFALLAPFVFVLLLRSNALARRLLLLVWIPAAVAGVTTALSSANGPINVAIGFFPALIATAVLVGLALQRVSPADFAPAVVLIAVGVALQYLSVYRDAGIQHLTTRVGEGPYAGIYTTAAKRDFLTALDRDVSGAAGPECTDRLLRRFPGRLSARPWPGGDECNLAPRCPGREQGPLSTTPARLLRATRRASRRCRAARSDPAHCVELDRPDVRRSRAPGASVRRTRYATVRAEDGYRIKRARQSSCRS